MRQVEIEKGLTYTDGKGAIRRVVDEGSHLADQQRRLDLDLVQYQLMTKERGPHPVGAILVCTRATFAQWAAWELMELAEAA